MIRYTVTTCLASVWIAILFRNDKCNTFSWYKIAKHRLMELFLTRDTLKMRSPKRLQNDKYIIISQAFNLHYFSFCNVYNQTHRFHPIKSATRDKCIHNLVTHGPGYFEMVKEGATGLYVASCRTGDYIIQWNDPLIFSNIKCLIIKKAFKA